ncbi:MAG: hypothetical protein WBD20_14170 [Pirellulaceae bacterium]
MLLIVGGESDPNTQRIVDQAHIREIEYRFWDTDLDHAHRIAWNFDSPQLDLGDDSVQPDSVFVRYNVFEGDAKKNLAAFDMIQSYVLAWPEITILNRRSMTDANNKSRNLRLAKELGFQIPETIVMGDLTPLTWIPNPASCVMKPLGGGAHTVGVDDARRDIDKLVGLGPQFVQEKLSGENLRVFCIGGETFCFHLRTTKLDYREDDSVEVVRITMPSELIEPSRKLALDIGFDYCALDFRCRNGMSEPVFLEINSFPMFVRFDDAGENCLADAVLDFLT